MSLQAGTGTDFFVAVGAAADGGNGGEGGFNVAGGGGRGGDGCGRGSVASVDATVGGKGDAVVFANFAVALRRLGFGPRRGPPSSFFSLLLQFQLGCGVVH